ncbi:MAG: FliI/YscN family ATPase [Thermotogae bacterium]|nr:FliI/YscN family ATPase [Thermotogota bacterium]
MRYLQKLKQFKERVEQIEPTRINGRVIRIVGLTVESRGPDAFLGELCHVVLPSGQEIPAEVTGFRENNVILMPLQETTGLSQGCEVIRTFKTFAAKVPKDVYSLLGRVVDGLGNPIDGGKWYDFTEVPVWSDPPNPLKRRRIKEPLEVGVRSVDAFLTLGKGQRIGIFSGSGVGKSTLLGMIARNTRADVNVIALVGERGREVREFLERDLGEEGLKRSIVVVATSDRPALVRVKALHVATAIAETFRDDGLNVMLMVDSLTRWAMAQREVGLSMGEPPAARGYTPSVFAAIPKILERAGTSEKGSITGIYTVLVEADDFNEPISDTARGVLDGHIILSRSLAEANHYPAVDVLMSVSRLMPEVVSEEHFQAASLVRSVLAAYNEARDLIEVGAYKEGTNKRVDVAIHRRDEIMSFLRQGIYEKSSFEETVERLRELSQKIQRDLGEFSEGETA